MPRSDNLYDLPAGLPIPLDDGACDHLTGMRLPSVRLASTAGGLVDLSSFGSRTVVYAYPRTGQPDQEPPGAMSWSSRHRQHGPTLGVASFDCEQCLGLQ